MSEPSRSVARTAAALATRRRNTQAALGRVRDTIARLRREKAPSTVAVVARRAGVSRTFLYTNPDAKTAVAEAIRQTGNQQHRLAVETDNARKSTWRERALNAEDALKTAHTDFCFNATAFANCSARSATWKPNGHAMTSSESPPRTPLLNSGSVSSSPTIARSTNDSKPPAPTCASKTVESPTSKPDRLSLRIPLRARAAHDHWQGQTSCLATQVNTWWKNRDTSTTRRADRRLYHLRHRLRYSWLGLRAPTWISNRLDDAIAYVVGWTDHCRQPRRRGSTDPKWLALNEFAGTDTASSPPTTAITRLTTPTCDSRLVRIPTRTPVGGPSDVCELRRGRCGYVTRRT